MTPPWTWMLAINLVGLCPFGLQFAAATATNASVAAQFGKWSIHLGQIPCTSAMQRHLRLICRWQGRGSGAGVHVDFLIDQGADLDGKLARPGRRIMRDPEPIKLMDGQTLLVILLLPCTVAKLAGPGQKAPVQGVGSVGQGRFLGMALAAQVCAFKNHAMHFPEMHPARFISGDELAQNLTPALQGLLVGNSLVG